MLPFDFIGQASVGCLFAIGAREELRAKPRPLHTRGFIDLVLFSTLVYTPSIVFFIERWPSWYVMYFVDVESPPTGVAMLQIVNIYGQSLCALAGFWLASLYLRRADARARNVVLSVIAIWAVQLPIYFTVAWSRSFTVVPFAQYATRPGFPIDWGQQHSFWGGPILGWWIFWVINDVAWLIWFYRRMRRRVPALERAGAPELAALGEPVPRTAA